MSSWPYLHRLSTLPLGIRREIWRFAIPSHRRIDYEYLKANPIQHFNLLLICKESKAVVDQCLTKIYGAKHPENYFLFDPKRDIVELDLLRFRGHNKDLQRAFINLNSPFTINNDLNFSLRNFQTLEIRVEEVLVIFRGKRRTIVLPESRQDFINFVCGKMRRNRASEHLLAKLQFEDPREYRERWPHPKLWVDVEAIVPATNVLGGQKQFDVDLMIGEVDWSVKREWMLQWTLGENL